MDFTDRFQGLELNEIRIMYYRLALEHHPDRGGSTANMQNLNAAYEKALRKLDGTKLNGEYTYNYNAEWEEKLMVQINLVLRKIISNTNDISVMMVGTWLWVNGETKKIKDTLKSMRFKWHSKRQMWYWHVPSQRKYRYSRKSFADICAQYGLRELKKNKELI